MKREKYAVDRIEEGILVMISESDGKALELSADRFGKRIHEGDIVYVSFADNGEICGARTAILETMRRKKEIKRKLSALFDKKRS